MTKPLQALMLLTLLGANPLVWAQQALEQRYILEQENIDMALTAQYEDGVRLSIAAMHRAGLGAEFNWQASQHGSTYFYIRQSPTPKLEPETRIKWMTAVLDDRDLQQYTSQINAAIRSRSVLMLEPRPQFSYRPGQSIDQARLNYVDIVHVHANRLERFYDATTRTIAALEEAGYPFGFETFEVIAGNPAPAEGPSYYLISPYNTRTQFYREYPLVGSIQKALGVEKATRLLLGQRDNLISGQSYDHIRRADLSYQTRDER